MLVLVNEQNVCVYVCDVRNGKEEQRKRWR